MLDPKHHQVYRKRSILNHPSTCRVVQCGEMFAVEPVVELVKVVEVVVEAVEAVVVVVVVVVVVAVVAAAAVVIGAGAGVVVGVDDAHLRHSESLDLSM